MTKWMSKISNVCVVSSTYPLLNMNKVSWVALTYIQLPGSLRSGGGSGSGCKGDNNIKAIHSQPFNLECGSSS
jgi:hypothetical protein